MAHDAVTPRAGKPVTCDADTGSVLVVDDDPLLAHALVDMLEQAGLSAMGPAGKVQSALALIAKSRPAFAILDFNLGRETSEEIARELRRLEVPFVCISGYASDQLPDVFDGVPVFSKPVKEPEVLRIVEKQIKIKTRGN